MQQPPDVWLGGIAPSRAAARRPTRRRLAAVVLHARRRRAGRTVIEETAAAHDRAIDPEHFGALVAYSDRPGARPRGRPAIRRRRPDLDPATLIPDSLPALRERLERFVDAGASKFVVIPLAEPADWDAELEAVAAALKPLET